MMMNFKFLTVLCILSLLKDADCHGRLVAPPGRSSMWRYGFNTPKNYDDNQLFCGGSSNQKKLNGSCGLCGDPFQGPRENEADGKYATETIAKCISTSESTLDVSVELTANHLGYFEFKLCDNNNFKKNFTQECLDKYPLKVRGNDRTRYYPGSSKGFLNFTLELPVGLTCSQCVLQWRYHTGNSWGVNDDGTGCLGCGHQEEFYACSDIKISSECEGSEKTTKYSTASTKPSTTHSVTTSIKLPTTTREITSSTQSITTPTKLPKTTRKTPSSTLRVVSGSSSSVNSITQRETTTLVTKSTPSTLKTTLSAMTPLSTVDLHKSSTSGLKETKMMTQSSKITTKVSPTPFESSTTKEHATPEPTLSTTIKYREKHNRVCVAAKLYKDDTAMTKWCINNCNAGFCPESHCTCADSETKQGQVLTCVGAGVYVKVPGMDIWCKNNCLSESVCPKTHCKCSYSE